MLLSRLAAAGSVCWLAAALNFAAASVKTYLNSVGFDVWSCCNSWNNCALWERLALSEEGVEADGGFVLPEVCEFWYALISLNSEALMELMVLPMEPIICGTSVTLIGGRRGRGRE